MSHDNTITVLNGAVSLRQPNGGFRTSIDAVLLAAACTGSVGQSILDLGCGVGSAGLCALARINDTRLTGLEVQKSHVRIATENAQDNNLSERTVFIEGDVRDFRDTGFDHVLCNPPYERVGAHLHSPSAAKAKAIGHTEEDIALEDWITCAFHCVKSGGSLTMIHKASEMQHLLQALGKSWGATEIIPLWPKQGREAKRVIIRTIKHRKSPARILPGLILHNHDGSYTEEAEAILRGGEALFA